MLTHSNDIWCAWKETVYARVKPYFVMIFTSRIIYQLWSSTSWRDATLPSPPPPHPPCYPMTLREILNRHVLHVVACPSLFHYREARMSGLFIPYLERRVRFPAIKTHSVPNLLARSSASGEQPIKTEKSNSAGATINRDSRNKR